MAAGPWFRLGLGTALVVLALDQLTKWWIIHVFELPGRGRVAVAPFLDLVMLWNPGISYGLFAQDTAFGRNILIAIAVGAALLLTVWMARTNSRLQAISLALIVGGAVGNAIDRAIYGAVADFVSLHAYGFYWYVFNIADAAIVGGALALLYDMVAVSHKIDAKHSDSLEK